MDKYREAMKMTIAKAKIKYNKLLERYKKAEGYFNRKDIPYKEKEKQLKNFQEVLKGLNFYLDIIGPYTSEQALGGF